MGTPSACIAAMDNCDPDPAGVPLGSKVRFTEAPVFSTTTRPLVWVVTSGVLSQNQSWFSNPREAIVRPLSCPARSVGFVALAICASLTFVAVCSVSGSLTGSVGASGRSLGRVSVCVGVCATGSVVFLDLSRPLFGMLHAPKTKAAKSTVMIFEMLVAMRLPCPDASLLNL